MRTKLDKFDKLLTNLHLFGYCMHFWMYLDTSDCTNIKLRANSLIFGYG